MESFPERKALYTFKRKKEEARQKGEGGATSAEATLWHWVSRRFKQPGIYLCTLADGTNVCQKMWASFSLRLSGMEVEITQVCGLVNTY